MDTVGFFGSSFFSVTSDLALRGDQYQVPRDGISVPFQDVVDGVVSHPCDCFYIPEAEVLPEPRNFELPLNTALMRFAHTVPYVGMKRTGS